MKKDLETRESDEHPFAAYVRILGKGKKGSRSLTASEAETAMGLILDEQVLDLQLGAFLMLLRVKEETPEELAGFVRAAKTRFGLESFSGKADLDWSSYAGKRRHPPWFLLTLKVLAGRGFRIAIHGTEGHTKGRVYTRDYLSALGIPCADSRSRIEPLLDQHSLCYIPLEVLHPRLEAIIQMRSVLGLRSPVHSMARLLNPLDAPVVMQGIFHPPYAPLHQQAAGLLGYPQTLVIKGEGGEIERNPDAVCKLFIACSDQNEQTFSEIEWPAINPRRHMKAETLDAASLHSLWHGMHTDRYAESAVVGTLALAIKGLGIAEDQATCHQMASEWWNARLA